MPAARTGPRPAPPPPAAASTAADRAGPPPPDRGTRSTDQAVAAVPQPCANFPKSNQDERRGNNARITGDARPGKTSPKRLNSRGRRAAPGRPRPRGSSIGLGSKKVKASGPVRRAPWPGARQPALAVPARQNRGGRGQDRNLPCDGQQLTAKSTAKSADRWVGSDEEGRWPAGTGTADAAGRVPPWSVADPGAGAGEDGPNSEKGQPPRAPSGWPAGEPACSRPIGPLGVISAPRNSHGLPESRSRRVLVLRPEGRVNLTAATAGGA